MSVIFDQLKVSDDGKKLFIKGHVNDLSYFDDVYLDNITIQTSDKVSETLPLPPTEGFIYKASFAAQSKNFDLTVDVASFDTAFLNWNPTTGLPIDDSNPYADTKFDGTCLDNVLFFVYVKVTGEPTSDCPCNLDRQVTVGVAFNEDNFYDKVMSYTNAIAKSCVTSNGFVDFLLEWNAYKAAVETEHFLDAIKYYDMMFNTNTDGTTTSKNCNCHG